MKKLDLEKVRHIAQTEFGTTLEKSTSQFDVELALSTVYDILGRDVACGCTTASLSRAVVFHIINKLENNPEKDTRALKLELASYLRAHGYFPGVRY